LFFVFVVIDDEDGDVFAGGGLKELFQIADVVL